MNTTFISIEGSYTNLELALFENHNCIQKISENNLKASSCLLPSLSILLSKNSTTLKDINFIAVNQGPGAFTSLRVIIATINGIAFTTQIPLIGIDGLDALTLQAIKSLNLDNNQNKNQKPTMLISLLNAYANDVYYSINTLRLCSGQAHLSKKIQPNGYKKIDILLEQIKKEFTDQTILFTGNGTKLHKDLIQEKLNKKAIIPENLIETPSVEQIGLMAFEKWKQEKSKILKLSPLYLKSQTFATLRTAPKPTATASTDRKIVGVKTKN